MESLLREVFPPPQAHPQLAMAAEDRVEYI